MNSLFILGAGASAHAKVPLMAEFLEVAEDISRSNEQSWPAQSAFDLVLRARASLQTVHSKAQFDLNNLEAVFAAFEMAELFGGLGKLGEEETSKLTHAMRTLIVETIEQRMVFAVRPEDNKIEPSGSYSFFGGLVHDMKVRGENVSVITFNYDVGVDFGLWAHGLGIDYCLGQPPVIGTRGETVVELMKLHGSMNWAECSKCQGDIVPREIRDIVHDRESVWAQGSGRPHQCTLNTAVGLDRLIHCHDNRFKPEPVIVAPTPNKGGFHRQLKHVWRRAAARLREADSIFVVGYSWPNADPFFRELYALGTVGDVILRHFWVIDPIPDIRKRYADLLLGPQAQAKLGPSVSYPTGADAFGVGLDAIARLFGIDPNLANRRRDTE